MAVDFLAGIDAGVKGVMLDRARIVRAQHRTASEHVFQNGRGARLVDFAARGAVLRKSSFDDALGARILKEFSSRIAKT